MVKSSTALVLAKQNFKFSSAHFLIFDEKRAEMLHGHNYRVRVRLGLPSAAAFEKEGYHIDFTVFKEFIKSVCDEWDEHVLLPAQNTEIKVSKFGSSLEVNFRDRRYVFPKNEVCLLPITNTSVEQLSRLLSEKIFSEFSSRGLRFVEVLVEETAGQGASFKISR